MFAFRRLVIVFILSVLCMSNTMAPHAVGAQTLALLQQDQPCFPETGQCTDGQFRQYWEQNGGLMVFGFPITAAVNETTPEGAFLTQYFERNRLEFHPENTPPYNVLLGRLGDMRLRQIGRDWQTEPRESGPKPGCLWFPETDHNVCNQGSDGGFKSYWESHGLQDSRLASYGRSLALFGLPLTNAQMETNADGATVLTQWFERARFEWHPDQPQPFRVLLGRLGTESYSDTPQKLTLLPTADTFVHQDFPDQNFGHDGLLAVDRLARRETYLKFSLPDFSSRVTSVKLQLYVTTLADVDGGSSSGGTVRRMSDTSWSEETVTYNTRPAVGSGLDYLGEVRPGQWYEFDVTAAVSSKGILGLAVTSVDENGAYYTSREVTTLEPRLVIELTH